MEKKKKIHFLVELLTKAANTVHNPPVLSQKGFSSVMDACGLNFKDPPYQRRVALRALGSSDARLWERCVGGEQKESGVAINRGSERVNPENNYRGLISEVRGDQRRRRWTAFALFFYIPLK